MASVDIQQDLQEFAIELFERSGGIADWPRLDAPGSVVMPSRLVAAAQLPGEEFLLDTVTASGTLQVGLAGEFLDVAARLLAVAVPRDGSFCVPDRHLTSRDLSDKIASTFVWPNARVKPQIAEPALIEYHQWTLLGSLQSEDVWESVIRVSVNAESQAIAQMPDLFQEAIAVVEGDMSATTAEEPTTYLAAILEGKQRLITESAKFVSRFEQRLERDRKRLLEYYRALSLESKGSKRRSAVVPSPDEIAAKEQAVALELRRKLAELNENYALRAVLRPVVLARVRVPVLVVPLTVQRKQATRDYRLFWNSVTKKFDPLSCVRCHRSTFSPRFANETVDLLCAGCAEKS